MLNTESVMFNSSDNHVDCDFISFFNSSSVLKQVVVRIRPVDNDGGEGDQNIIKVSSDSLYVGDRQFTFDMVFDSDSNQVRFTLQIRSTV